MDQIARRAKITTASIYNHFAGKDELLLESAVYALDTAMAQLRDTLGESSAPVEVLAVRAFMDEDFAPTRRLLIEIHLAAMRHRRVGEIVAAWHQKRLEAAMLAGGGRGPLAITATWLLLMGICHLDSFAGVIIPSAELTATMEAAVSTVSRF